MNLFRLVICALMLFSVDTIATAQVFDPNDPIITYDEDNPPAVPNLGIPAKWVRTKRVGWNTNNYKSYIYNGVAFRLRFPENYSPDEEYPLVIMFHGAGERGTIYDNELNLKHGGSHHERDIANGKFPGFALFPQNTQGYWSDAHLAAIHLLLREELYDIGVDRNKVAIHGLSAGGGAVWTYAERYPKDVAAALPMSSSAYQLADLVDIYKYIPIWLSQGGRDGRPSPFTSGIVVDALAEVGGNIRYSLYPTKGHNVWYDHYADPDFWSYILRANKTNPVVLTGQLTTVSTSSYKEISEFLTKTEICPGDAIEVRMGLTNGYDSYQWKKNGVLIPDATSNEYVATELGIYEARFMEEGVWTEWSETPIEITEKEVTNTPDIIVSGLASKVLPAPDGNTSVPLELPQGYVEYKWRLVGTSEILSTDRVFNASTPGEYEATVTEQFGCSSNYSNSFTVVDANGANTPNEISTFVGFASSKTSIRLQWTVESSSFPATGYEIYRSEVPGGTYHLIGLADGSSSTYDDENLNADTDYYYIVRPVNEFAAASSSSEIAVRTEVDDNAPSAPAGLKVDRTGSNYVTLSWDSSVDDVGVYKYDVYRDGVKSVVTESTSVTVFNLTEGNSYQFSVKARDLAGNNSPFSNVVIGAAVQSGINYQFFQKDWSENYLVDLRTKMPLAQGNLPNFDIGVRQFNTNYVFLFEGKIKIPYAGSYTFQTKSDDGSKLYIGAYEEANLVVNNDGNHGMQTKEGTVNFDEAGYYPIYVAFYQEGGGQGLEVRWRNTAHGVTNSQIIPDEFFEAEYTLPGTPPDSPTEISANAISYDQVDIAWVDNSDNETGFQIYRSEAANGPYLPIALVGANTTNFTDFGVEPSTTYHYQAISIGEYGPSGTVSFPSSDLGAIRNGVAALDNATGNGYIMYSERNVFTRFNANRPNSSNSDHLIAVKYFNDQWYYDNNSDYYPLALEDGDLLIADVDFSNDQITSLEGTQSTVNGIEAGYASGDLVFYADRWGNSNNDGEFRIEGTVINRNVDLAIATTDDLPAVPSQVADFAVETVTGTSVELSWSSVAGTDLYRLLRSPDGTTYLPIAELVEETSTYNYSDDVAPHSEYYYRLYAANAGGESDPAELTIETPNAVPVISDLPEDIVTGFDSTYDLQLFADDEDGDAVSFTASNLPSFALLTDYGDGSALLEFTASEEDAGIYNDIQIEASDSHGGVDQHIINVEVNSNSLPTLSTVEDVFLLEGETVDFQLVATDAEGVDNLSWSFDVPDFVTYNLNVGGIVDMQVSPGYIDAGLYTASATVEDQDGASKTVQFSIEVSDFDPNTNILVNFSHTTQASSPWNNIGATGVHDLLTTSGEERGVSLEFLTEAWYSYLDGAQSAENTGVFPNDVLKDYYYFGIFGAPESVQFVVRGLDPETAYNLSFLASSVWPGAAENGSTVFTIDGTNVSLAVQGNTQNTADFNSLLPDSNGEILVTMTKGANTPVGYLNGFSISTTFGLDDEPAAPRNLTATMQENAVSLSWIDVPFNEDGFRIYKSEDGVNFSEIGEVGQNMESFEDADVVAGVEYTYAVSAFNSIGESGLSEVVEFLVPNIAPTLDVLGSTSIFTNQASILSFVAADSPGDVVVISVSSLPPFGTFNTTADGGEVVFNPVQSDIGIYRFTVSAEDNNGGLSTRDILLSVSEESLYSVSVNFGLNSNEGNNWNNTSKAPVNGDVFSDLVDNTGGATSVSVSLLTSFGGVYDATSITGDDSGVVPDDVLKEYYWWGIFNAPEQVSMKVSGLDIDTKYTFKFVGSSTFDLVGITDNGETVYTIGNKSVSVYVQGNTDTAGELTGIAADPNGEVVIKMTKGNGASAGYINALIIEAYPGEASIYDPSDLTAKGISQSEIDLSWSDNSFDEEAFEIHRSTSKNGTYELVGTVDANVTTYQDSGLAGGQLYFYKVRAHLGASEYSPYSNTASSGTIAYSVYVNINGDAAYNASVPWNNLGFEGSTGKVFTGFKNQNGNPTGIALEVINGMQGSNNWGVSTGDDSGVYPDDVMQSFFFSDAAEAPGHYKLKGLDVGFQYNLDFFGSIQTIYHVGTSFAVNGDTVSTYQTNNIDEVVGIDGIVPNENGEIEFTVQEVSWSRWAIFNALVIEAYPIESNVQARTANNAQEEPILGDYTVTFGNDLLIPIKFSVYPNPVRDVINVVFEGVEEGQPVSLSLHDLNGKKVLHRNFELSRSSKVTVTDGIEELLKGIYVLTVSNGKEEKVTRIIKQ